jgi:hypothetical protein
MRALQLLGTFVSGDLSTIFFTVQPRYMKRRGSSTRMARTRPSDVCLAAT